MNEIINYNIVTRYNELEYGNKYVIDGVFRPSLALTEGHTYRFDQSDSSNNGHPIRFSTTSDGIHNGGSDYLRGVSAVGVMGEEVFYTQITVPEGAPTLYYYCANHRGMGNQLEVANITISNPVDKVSPPMGDETPHVVAGSNGDDQLISNLGDDIIAGGLGTDVVVFSGERSAYTITETGNTVVVTDSQSSRDGSDTLTSIENFQFSDGTFRLSELLNVTDIDRGIYRFFNVDTGTHFLSGSTVERDSVINNLDAFNFEGPTFRAADSTNAAADTVFRFFNTQTGTHFFTQSTVERDNILDTLPQFSFEGEAYKGYTEQVDGSIPLYRFFNTQTGTHFYTAAEAEKDSIVANLPSFNFEGTAYWVDPVIG